MPSKKVNRPLNIVIVGASGNLARNKIYPALFSLYCQNFLPADIHIFGFARTFFAESQFRAHISKRLTCRYTPNESCDLKIQEFLAVCHYLAGDYSSYAAFLDLYESMKKVSRVHDADHMFYFAIPPSVFIATARALGNAGLVICGESSPRTRVVIEKPFGQDRDSSDLLAHELRKVFTDEQVYRIDHYLGKELIQNLLVLRFANRIFRRLWNNKHIERVDIVWKEQNGVDDRAGYFDQYGIIRDVIQNHLFQVLGLIAMEPPDKLSAQYIGRKKTLLLRSVEPIRINDLVSGQYVGRLINDTYHRGYREENGVPADSLTPTYAAIALRINNKRWRGVPFTIVAGKALNEHLAEVRIRFRAIPENTFCFADRCPDPNELIIRIQPNEGILLKIATKVPGSQMIVETRTMDLLYQSAFRETIPEAYEKLLIDVIRSDKSLFVGNDELAAAWDIITPVLHEMDERRLEPTPYLFGSPGPGFPSSNV
ncbi:MAG: glucose-6-phosphate dehydrogenase [Lentisphaerae bacterium]|nr:glucose-6-phosphate dehydrogenase [Lentisphaerota bacterium]